MSRLTRREVLAALAAAPALGCTGSDVGLPGDGRAPVPTRDWEGLGEPDLDHFPLGVQSGDPLPRGLLLWTRYLGAAELTAHLWAWKGEEWIPLVSLPASPDDQGLVHLDAGDLPVDAGIAFQFEDAEGRLSPVGHGRTALDRDAWSVVRFGATSCLHQSREVYPNLTAAVERGPLDFWLWLGDTVYVDAYDGYDAIAGVWERNFARPDFQAVLSRVPGVFTWDDHEIYNDWTEDPEAHAHRFDDGYAAFFGYTPLRRHPTEERRIYRSLRFGRTAEVFVLDCRGERDEANGIYLSEAQMQWLKEGLSSSRCTWKIVVNSVPITDLPGPYDVPLVIRDRWDGYPEQRQEILSHIADNDLRGVLWVTGDVHHPALCRIDGVGPGARILEAFTGPSGSNLNPLGSLIMDEDQFAWSDTAWNAARFEVNAAGFGRIVWVTDADETLCEAIIDDRGNILSLEWRVQEFEGAAP